MNKVIVDKARLLRRVIVISWIALALCFVIKIFGGNFFEIMCENPNYKALCEYADSHFWCKYLLAFLSSFISISLYLLAIIKEYKFTRFQFIFSTISIALCCGIKLVFPNYGFIGDIWMSIITPIIFLGKNFKGYLAIVVAILLTLIFEIISLLVKNMAIKVIDDNTFISLIYMIDVYIMCFLYYLYRNYQKENKNMGAFFLFFAGKPVDKLKEMKAKREKQIAKLNEEIKAIETEIAKRSDKK